VIRNWGVAYALGGDDLAAAAGTPLGLPLPERWAIAFGVPDAAAVLCAVGDEAEDEDAAAVIAGAGRSEEKDGRSWGAGEGAIAMAVLMAIFVAGGCIFGGFRWVRVSMGDFVVVTKNFVTVTVLKSPLGCSPLNFSCLVFYASRSLRFRARAGGQLQKELKPSVACDAWCVQQADSLLLSAVSLLFLFFCGGWEQFVGLAGSFVSGPSKPSNGRTKFYRYAPFAARGFQGGPFFCFL
jgi:hypothetical protein